MTEMSVREDVSLEGLIAQAADEFLEQHKRGERPDIEEYAARYPEAAVVLRKVLASLEIVGVSLSAAGALVEAPEQPQTGILGDFHLIREVGRGGMGIVYEAEQISLGRRVALKVLPFAATMDQKQLQRFHNEAKAAASLHHEHIVPVYFVGCERSVHFYAMQYIDGCTLAQFINALQPKESRVESDANATQDHQPLSSPLAGERQGGGNAPTVPIAALSTERSGPSGRQFYRQAAELIVQAADALEHAHSLGIVHRDIKPANLLIDQAGKLWVGDFGLARLGTDAGLTMSGDVLGTLRYMAPEQALARHGLVDHRADVYALGATLYELLTLHSAVTGSERAEVLRQVAFEDPTPPRKLDKAIPAELETIALKCLVKNPNERYATAQELANDLRRFLDDKPIRARRPTPVQRGRKWLQRNPGLVWAAAAGLLLGTGVSVWQAVEANRARRLADERLDNERKADTQARASYRKALEAVEQMLFRVAEEKLEDPEKERLRLREDAVAFYTDLISLNPREAEVYLKRASVYGRLSGQLERARSDCETALELDPNNAEAHAVMGSVLVSRGLAGDREKAVAFAKRSVELDGANPTRHATLGSIHAMVGETNEAVRSFRRAAELLGPASARGYFYLGRGAAWASDFRGALAHFERCLSLSGSDRWISDRIGMVYET